jgi:recombination protein RecT
VSEQVQVVEQPQVALKEWVVSDKVLASLKQVAIQGIDPARFARLLLASAASNPKILQCSPTSVFLALASCLSTGLEPNTPAQEAYIIPYKGSAQFQAGFRGLEKLARRNGKITSIESRVVHVSDEFSYEFGLDPKLVHKPAGIALAANEDLRAAYSVVRFNDGTPPSFEVMLASELLGIRKTAKEKNGGVESPAWKLYAGEMYRKIVFKRHAKWLPQDDLLSRAIDLDNRVTMGEQPVFDVDLEEVTDGAPARSQRLEKEEL